MNITWIIGNGFDLNLGLKTGYDYFVQNVYLPKESENRVPSDKRLLIERVDALPEWGSDKWSDLESLAGKVTANYEVGELDSYCGGFEGLLVELRNHLLVEQERGVEIARDNDFVDEARDTLVHINQRLPPRDSSLLGDLRGAESRVVHNFISLNYTKVLDATVESIREKYNPLERRTVRNAYNDAIGTLLHAHGTLDEDGGLVFGLSDAGQIANSALAQNNEFQELWIKEKRNHLFGNNRCEAALQLIKNSNVIVIYGCSLGESDAYLWNAVTGRLRESAASRLLVFSHEMPVKGTMQARKSQLVRNAIVGRLLSYGESNSGNLDITNHIIINNSGLVFKYIQP